MNKEISELIEVLEDRNKILKEQNEILEVIADRLGQISLNGMD